MPHGTTRAAAPDALPPWAWTTERTTGADQAQAQPAVPLTP
ncbi:hypothetical protein [Streptomyces paludis]|nr:hypothetical protein [Streptomyces paludis]